jgi:hypothetical protein
MSGEYRNVGQSAKDIVQMGASQCTWQNLQNSFAKIRDFASYQPRRLDGGARAFSERQDQR